jgi:hypothetical protein
VSKTIVEETLLKAVDFMANRGLLSGESEIKVEKWSTRMNLRREEK